MFPGLGPRDRGSVVYVVVEFGVYRELGLGDAVSRRRQTPSAEASNQRAALRIGGIFRRFIDRGRPLKYGRGTSQIVGDAHE